MTRPDAAPATHEATVGAILSVLTPTMLCEMDELYDLLNFMLDRSLLTHELPDAADLVKPTLAEQHPDLAAIDTAGLQVMLQGMRTCTPRIGRVESRLRAEQMCRTFVLGIECATGGHTRLVARPDPVPVLPLRAPLAERLGQARRA